MATKCMCICVRGSACQDQEVKEVQCRSTCCTDHVCDPVVKHRLIGTQARRTMSTRAPRAAIDNGTDPSRWGK